MHRPEQVRTGTRTIFSSGHFLTSLLLCPEAGCHRLHAEERPSSPWSFRTPAPASTNCALVHLPAARGEWLSVPYQTLRLPLVPGKPQAGDLPLSNTGHKLLIRQSQEPVALTRTQDN